MYNIDTEAELINVPGDGNCLFHACIRAKKLLDERVDRRTVTSSTTTKTDDKPAISPIKVGIVKI